MGVRRWTGSLNVTLDVNEGSRDRPGFGSVVGAIETTRGKPPVWLGGEGQGTGS